MIQKTVRWRSHWLDGAVVARCLGTPGQTKVSGDCQRETTHEICCLAAEFQENSKLKGIYQERASIGVNSTSSRNGHALRHTQQQQQ